MKTPFFFQDRNVQRPALNAERPMEGGGTLRNRARARNRNRALRAVGEKRNAESGPPAVV